ncbi:MAG: cob(I)yrinic acid a,c-diamide adenosyltransferase [Candidatus Paceibacterota bacterium]|jgi:cob(I)alamin adenosyltransferase
MLYTRKGDDGSTKTFGCDQRTSKSSLIAEALGSLDEANSFLGIVKTSEEIDKLTILDVSFKEIIHQAQESLFIVQAEVAGAGKTIGEDKVQVEENIIADIEKTLPPIKTFFISGGTNIATSFDFARTLVRRAERRVVAVSEQGLVKISPHTLAYLNRLSSLLYALARLSNHKSGINERSPKYN